MKISEMMDKLGKILNEYGDLEAYTTSGTWGDLEVECVVVRKIPKFPADGLPDPPRAVIC